VVKDAVFATVSSQNPALPALLEKGINAEILKGIYITGEITTWDQVTGSSGKGVELHIYTRSDSSGAAEIWAKFLGKRQEDLLGIGVFGDPGIMDAVVKDPLGIGYNNLNYAFDAKSGKPVEGAVVLPIDVSGNGKADPEEVLDTRQKAITAVASGRYPSPPARDLNLVTKGQPTGLVQDFLLWVLNQGQQYVDQAGYVSLPDEYLAEQQDKIK
jgi:phosphate transport system substrate-binding protein